MNDKKPNGVFRFLKWFCPDHLFEEIEGDLIQKFERDVRVSGRRRAHRRLVWNTICFFRPGIISRNKFSIALNHNYMFAHYWKVSTRVLLKNKSFSAINIFGLTLGITGALLLFLWIEKEFSYDQFHADKERIYKAWSRRAHGGQTSSWDHTPRILASTLSAEYSNVEAAVSLAHYTSALLITAGETRVTRNTINLTDPEFLSIFSFPLIKGDVASAMKEPSSIVLTENFARQLFGDKEAFGETVTILVEGENVPLTVSGILKDLPSNTDVHFEFLIPFALTENIYGKETEWGNNSVATYVKIRAGADIQSLNEGVKGIRRKHANDDIEIFLYPLTEMHLYSRFENGVPVGGRIELMRMLILLGICLMVIACINFVNLSTARALKRSKEVAVRKVTGAYRHSLVMQFLCESVLIAWGAGIISVLAVYLTLPFFNTLVQQQLTLNMNDVTFWAGLILFITLVGVLAGSYPALYLSSFQPVQILKGTGTVFSGRGILRTLLTVFQFGFAFMLIVGTVVVFKQIVHVQNRDTGYARENLVYHDITGSLSKNFQAYKNELIQSGVALSVTRTSSPITERWSNSTEMTWSGKDPQNNTNIERFYIDQSITTTAGIKIIEGRDMDLQRFPSDSSAVLLNEAALAVMGFTNPIGEIIRDNDMDWHVVGVVEDFVLTAPYQKVEPVILPGSQSGWFFNVIHIRLNPAHPVTENLALLSKLFSKYNPDYPFEYHFADVEYERKFANLQTTLTITALFSSLAIFIACLGLLGLSTYMIEARVKEIGIRKVMGGSVASITRLLSMNSLKPVFIAIVVFSPLEWLALNWWLQSFAYRITLDAGLILIGAVSIMFIALLTVVVQTVRAAGTNPVNSLRNE